MRSMIYTANTATQTVPVGGTVALGQEVRKSGCGLVSGGSSIVAKTNMPVLVTVSVTAAPSAAGAVTVALYRDGVAIPGATATQTVAANGTASLAFSAIVRGQRCACADASTLTVVLLGTASDVSNVAVTAVEP